MNKKGNVAPVVAPFLALLALATLVVCTMGFDFVPAGHIGVTDHLGQVGENAWGPGISWTGVFTKTVDYSTRIQIKEYEAGAASKDMQDVYTKVVLNFRVNPTTTPEIYKTIGTNYQDVIIFPIVQEAIKSNTAKYEAEKLVTDRAGVKRDITNYVTAKLESKGLIVTEVAITDFQFSPEYTDAIERKQVAQQDALTAENKFKEMEWTSKSMELQSKVLEIKKLDLQLEWINSWNGELPQTLIINGDEEGDMSFLLGMN